MLYYVNEYKMANDKSPLVLIKTYRPFESYRDASDFCKEINRNFEDRLAIIQ